MLYAPSEIAQQCVAYMACYKALCYNFQLLFPVALFLTSANVVLCIPTCVFQHCAVVIEILSLTCRMSGTCDFIKFKLCLDHKILLIKLEDPFVVRKLKF
jgi:hypothetical protein